MKSLSIAAYAFASPAATPAADAFEDGEQGAGGHRDVTDAFGVALKKGRSGREDERRLGVLSDGVTP